MLNHELYIEDLEQINSIHIPWERLENRSILITGGTGLIGSVLVDSLIYRNEEKNAGIAIWVLARNEVTLKERFADYINRPYFHYLIQDVCNQIDMDNPIDFIIHGASKGDPYSFVHDPVGVMNANYIGTYQVLELARKKSCEKVLFISSGEVYGVLDNMKRPIGENSENGIKETEYGYLDILNTRSCYASSKRAAETLCISYSDKYGIKVNIARPCHTYGPTMQNTDSRVIGEFIRDALQHKNIVMKSEGVQERSYCYAADTVAALLTILLIGENSIVYNIANKVSVITIRRLAELIANKTGTKVIFNIPKSFEKKGYSDIIHAVLDASKLEDIGWHPNYGISDGIDRVMKILY